MNLSALVLTLSAHALPLYEPAEMISEDQAFPGDQEDGQCIPMNRVDGVWDDVASTIDDRVHVYLSANFAAVYTDPGNPDVDNGATQDQVRNTLLEAMDVWNRESRGPVFRFEGETAASLRDNATLATGWTCEALDQWGGENATRLKTPAVIVSPWAEGSALGGVYVIGDASGECAEETGLAVVGLNIQEPGTLEVMKWTLVHELGHVLGLGHAFGDSDNKTNGELEGAPSVMHYDLDDFAAATNRAGDDQRSRWRTHLWPYDVDCVDDDLGAHPAYQEDARVRELVTTSRAYNPSTNTWSNTRQYGFSTSKGGTTSGAVETSSGLAYPFVVDASAQWSFVYGASHSIGTGASNVRLDEFGIYQGMVAARDTFISPTALSVREKTSGSHDWVLLAADRPNSPSLTTIGANDPPRVLQGRSSSIGTASYVNTLQTRLPGSTQLVKSHIAMRSAWDPSSDTTLFVSVPTRDCADGANDSGDGDAGKAACFQPRVHVGYGGGGSYNYTLASPDTPTLAELVLPPAPDAGDSYTGLTHVAPAIACAPVAYGAPGNCMLAWVDDGVADNHILVTWFSVTNGTVTWSGTTERMEPDRIGGDLNGGANLFGEALSSSSDLSAVYNDGRFFVALKSTVSGDEGQVAVVRTPYRNLDAWYRVDVLPSKVDEAPFLMADPVDDSLEMVLVYTHLDGGV